MTTKHSSHYYDTDRNRMLPEQEKARGITDAERAAMNDTRQAQPASPAEVEELAKQAVEGYLDACRMTDRAQIGNYLMKLCSVASVVMAQADGSEIAGLRLEGTAAWVRKTMPSAPARLEKLQ